MSRFSTNQVALEFLAEYTSSLTHNSVLGRNLRAKKYALILWYWVRSESIVSVLRHHTQSPVYMVLLVSI